MVRIVLDEFLRQVAHEVDEILFAQLCIQTYFHRAWVQRVGDIEIDISFSKDIRIGRLQHEIRQLYVVERGVESYACGEISDLYAALVFHGHLPYKKRSACWRVADGVDAEAKTCEGDMVVVETIHLRRLMIVVFQLAVIPVETLNLIGVVAEADVGFAGDGTCHKGFDVECVARQMQTDVCADDIEAVGIDAPVHL